MSPCQAIKLWCYECSGFDRSEVRNCPDKKCPLWPYRQGKNPNRKGKGGFGKEKKCT
jgi:hypothetical protein